MFNRVITIGNLTRDIELRYTPNALAIAKSSIATSHKYKAASGEIKEEVCFLEFNIMGKMAETANQYLRKGSTVMLDGRPSDNNTASTGQQQYNQGQHQPNQGANQTYNNQVPQMQGSLMEDGSDGIPF
jgi:single-stranded DNA-binding protein